MHVDVPVRQQCQALVVHLRRPGKVQFERATVNGKVCEGADAASDSIRIEQPAGALAIVAEYNSQQ